MNIFPNPPAVSFSSVESGRLLLQVKEVTWVSIVFSSQLCSHLRFLMVHCFWSSTRGVCSSMESLEPVLWHLETHMLLYTSISSALKLLVRQRPWLSLM